MSPTLLSTKITIINAYGDKNIGDSIILDTAIRFIHKAYKNKCDISVLCEDKNCFSNFIYPLADTKLLQSPYGYAISATKVRLSSIQKVRRFLEVFIQSYSAVFTNNFLSRPLSKGGFYSYIKEIKDADLVIGMGGGYLTTNTQYTDYFGLLLTLLPIHIAKIYKKKIIMLPLSFGPFASKAQERITYEALKNTTTFARDETTLHTLQKIDKNKTINCYYAPDLALFLKKYGVSNLRAKLRSNYIVLTAREWFSDLKKQAVYEDSLSKCIDTIWESHHLKTVFIPMARNSIEDDDNRVAKRIMNTVKDKKSIGIITPKNIHDLQRIIRRSRLAICTRMHSAIVATNVDTPFIAIGYGHKMLGFTKSFNIEKWHIRIDDVRYEILLEMFDKLLLKKNYIKFIKTISQRQKLVKNYKKKIMNELLVKNS